MLAPLRVVRRHTRGLFSPFRRHVHPPALTSHWLSPDGKQVDRLVASKDSSFASHYWELVFLGTSSGKPTRTRGVSCVVLQRPNTTWVFDCGESSSTRLYRTQHIAPPSISKIFITHLHGDHLWGLQGVIASALVDNEASNSNNRVDVYGPPGLAEYIDTVLRASAFSRVRAVVVHELLPTPTQPPVKRPKSLRVGLEPIIPVPIPNTDSYVWNLFEDSSIHVAATQLDHSVTCFGYVMTEPETPGSLDGEKVRALGVHYKDKERWQALKQGLDVVLKDGNTLRAADVLGPAGPGRRLVIMGDTSSPGMMKDLVKSCTVLVHEATLEHKLREAALARKHSTTIMAADTANLLGAKFLFLTHFSPRYSDTPESAVTTSELLEEAQYVFQGKALKAQDFLVVRIGRHPVRITQGK